MSDFISIENAKYIEDYKIYIKFNDGKENIVDFKNFIEHSSHPDIKKYQDKNLFKNFSLDYGDIEWNDYELAFPIYDLYRGQI
ncbi:MAG TPA: DUF2442 domain-containing protein [Sulfurospirillum arcachonense]|nr:DUF2442 domain-containing protein [Sulfurospirillum arcachonense]HIP44183.1 DUF2442 domain-containing protein [Sulfurospirillum arcachonense]